MDRIKINLLSIRDVIDQRRKKKKRALFLAKAAVFCGTFFILIGGIFSVSVLFSNDASQSGWSRLPILSQIQRLARSAEKNVMGEDDDRINVLLLGMGGAGHEAGNLTDTIMVVSLKPSTSQVALFSVPRDLIIPVPNRGWRKINSVNAFAEEDFPGMGAKITAETMGRVVLNQPIHYYVRVDFDAFSDFIDDMGGIEVCVERALNDYSYPIRGQEDNPDYYARFEYLHVNPGCQKMEGDLALKYVRSRHGAGQEGSDFARARRQQLVLRAVKEKLFSTSTLLNPMKLGDLYVNYKKHVSTNIEIWEVVRFAKMAKDIRKEDIIQKVLDHSADSLLYSAISSQGAYILQPRAGDFSEIQELFKNIFSTQEEDTEEKEEFSIEVQNGTTVPGLAKKSADQIEELGYTVSAISNAPVQEYAKTVIYDFTNGKAVEAIRDIKQYFNANVSTVIPDWVKVTNGLLPLENQKEISDTPAHEETTDILVILGNEIEFL